MGTVLVVAASALSVGLLVPAGNELTYLVLLRRFADPSYLPGDWTFGSGFEEFFVWLRVFGPLANLLGVELLAWIGRILTWAGIGLALLFVGRRLGARPFYGALAMVVWLGLSQSMGVGATRVIAEFQARSVAYPLLFAGLVFALDKKVPWAMLMAGLAFSFHPGVGLWGSSFLVLALLVVKETRARAWRGIWIPIVAGLPGAVPQVLSLLRSNLTSADADFLAIQRIPHHVDPFSFGQRGPLLFALMLAFNLLLHWKLRHEFVHRFLGLFQVLALLPVVIGVLARLVGFSSFLILLPFRVLPALVPALFLLNLAALATRRDWRELWPAQKTSAVARWQAIAGLAAIVGALVLWNPVTRLAGTVLDNVRDFRAADDDVERVLRWTATETPADSVVLAPPDRDDLFYLSERAQYVSWEAIPYDRVPEWRQRLEAVMTPEFFPVRQGQRWEEDYAALTVEQLQALDPAVDFIVTTAQYELPEVFNSGDWSVYRVGEP